MLREAIRLHCLMLVKTNLGWYLREGVISVVAGKKIEAAYNEAVWRVLSNTNDWLDAFDLPMHQHIHAPIARDYVTYSGHPKYGDIHVAGKLY